MFPAIRSIPLACIVAVAAAAAADARLNDIAIVGAEHAWAVGDRGTVLHSPDGGVTWQEQTTPTDVHLAGVSFVNAQRGWAVGGCTRPHTLLSQATVLATSDGGRTWRRLPARNLPALADVKFFDGARGVAIGRASSMQASGVFVTQDGGQTWRGLAGGSGWSWQAGDFVDPTTGGVAGRGLWAGVAGRTLQATLRERPRIRAIHDLMLVPPTGGWAAGDGGLVLTTPNLGRAWFAPPSPLPSFAARHFDLKAVAAHGSNVWAAGAPGSRVFHSTDGGRTWQSYWTGVPTALESLQFVDDLHGIAVGDLGAILTTDDGGRSWQVRRRGGSRTPLMVVAAREEAVPLEVLARASADDGYLASVDVLLRPPLDDTAATPLPHALVNAANDDVESRLHEATLSAGGTASTRAWRFPLAQTATGQSEAAVLAELDRQTDGRTLELLEAHLARQIRMWRPDVIVVGASPSGPTPEDALVREIALKSVAAAADPTRHVDLVTDADLAAWQARRVFAVDPDGTAADLLIAGSTFAARRGATVGQIAHEARSILTPSAESTPAQVALEQLLPAAAPARPRRTPFDGIELAPGSDGRRAAAPLADAQVQQATAAAEKRRNVRAILASQGGNAALASHLAMFTDGVDDASQARVLYELADGYRTAGQRPLAAQMLERLAREHPESDLVDAALVWLIQYHAGSETQWSEQGSGFRVQASTATSSPSPQETAITIAHLAADLRPNLLLEPQVGVPLAAAYRRAGLAKESDRYMLLLRQRGADDAWRQLADAERWLADPTEAPPSLPIWTCRRTAERPHLDGVLDETFWRTAPPAVLRAKDQETGPSPQTVLNDQMVEEDGAKLQLAFDGEFLYLAIHVDADSTDADDNVAPPPRRRDEDLTGCDRISIAIDLDRDLTTYYELTIDDRGRAHESAWHDPRWNPKWYIAQAAEEHGWTIEAALPIAELSSTGPQSRDVWCVAAGRIKPDGRVTPWQGPATAEPSPASFGLLIFD